MWRFWLVGVVAIVGVALGGCGDERPVSPLVAEPETVGKMPDRGGPLRTRARPRERTPRKAHGGAPGRARVRGHPKRGRRRRTLGLGKRRRSEEHTSELQSRQYLVCRLLLEKKKKYYKKSLIIRHSQQ